MGLASFYCYQVITCTPRPRRCPVHAGRCEALACSMTHCRSCCCNAERYIPYITVTSKNYVDLSIASDAESLLEQQQQWDAVAATAVLLLLLLLLQTAVVPRICPGWLCGSHSYYKVVSCHDDALGLDSWGRKPCMCTMHRVLRGNASRAKLSE